VSELSTSCSVKGLVERLQTMKHDIALRGDQEQLPRTRNEQFSYIGIWSLC